MTDDRRWYAGVRGGSQNQHVVSTDEDDRKLAEKILKYGGAVSE